MKKTLALSILLMSAASASALDFSGFLSSWKQDCAGGCALPAGEQSGAASFAVDEPMNPGEARTAKFERAFVFQTGEKVQAVFSVYFVCPRGAKGEPGGDSCPSRYLQVQAVLSGDARAFCGAALNLADARPFPVLMCAGENARRPGERLGVSLSREDVSRSSRP